MPHVNKKTLARNENLIQTKKLGLEWTMIGLEKKTFGKKYNSKNRKTVKIKVKLPHVNKKPPTRKQNFVQTPISYSTLK